ncbi:LytTR family transcriptional regulator DNA-binding domain-containing protein [Cytobacillus gottheilii]|uniref:LytTR family transcriptional regulator DNA-binding domain-containing protein n=1 Tax=Cytobacillus gottheilii TaxID=859144 RepID=UPI0009B94FD0|nr:LytTR family transcriptional regulator DNA-binding domain-containing protein [Cytobacillus gottheilii]
MTILSFNNIEKHDGHTIVFPSFQLSIESREIIGLLTSINVRTVLLEMMSRKLPVPEQAISIDGVSIHLMKREYFQRVSFFSLEDGLYERLTVKETFLFYQKLFNSDFSLEQILQQTQLETKKNIRIGKLTTSEKRRVHYGHLLLKKTDIYILEEPDQNVDLETKRVLMKMIQELQKNNKTVLVLTSNMESALAVTDNIYRLDELGLHKLDVMQQETEKEAAAEEELEPIIQPVRFEKIPTKVNDKIILFDPPEIDYIESSEGSSQLYIKGDMYQSMFTLNELEQRLLPYGFYRCHRSYIVNLQKVREVITWTRNSYSLVLHDQSSIPLSKTKMAELKEMLGLK